MENDWISIHRKFKDWQWYKNINVKTVFLHLLLKANYKDNYWKDVLVRRGECITSIEHLSDETGLTIQQTRTALNKLKSTQEITIKTTNKYTLISITKYDFYQDNNKKITNEVTSNETNDQQTNNKQITTNNKDNKYNNNNIYINLFNKYTERVRATKWFGEKIKVMSELEKDEDYLKLSYEDRDRLFKELM